MIEIAAILSVVVHHWADFWIILALLVVNEIVGFWEEYQAGNAIAADEKLALRAKVNRDGAWGEAGSRRQSWFRRHGAAADRRHCARRRQVAAW